MISGCELHNLGVGERVEHRHAQAAETELPRLVRAVQKAPSGQQRTSGGARRPALSAGCWSARPSTRAHPGQRGHQVVITGAPATRSTSIEAASRSVRPRRREYLESSRA
jgi:hypothetical protein